MKIDITEFDGKLSERLAKVQNGLPKTMALMLERVRSTALDDMAKTPRNNDVTYGKKGHHPSLPGNAPAPDTDNLREHIHYTIDENQNVVVGIVGTDVKYGKVLEYGSHKGLKPRPWLKPALDKNEEYIKSKIKEVILND